MVGGTSLRLLASAAQEELAVTNYCTRVTETFFSAKKTPGLAKSHGRIKQCFRASGLCVLR